MAMIDTLIIGQGLAGSLLAWQLIGRGQRVMVLDDGYQSAASTVAAGLLNPITGQRMVKGAEVDDCLPTARACYRELETVLQRPLLFELPMWRLFQNEAEHTAWQKRCNDPAYAPYLGEALPKMSRPHAPLGGFVQQQTGYLDTRALLDGLCLWLQQQDSYQRQSLDYAQLQMEGETVCYGGIQARQMVFCEGWRAIDNPWFDWLPLAPSRGTILTLHSDIPLADSIINQGRWLMPRGEGEYRLGASYDRECLDADPQPDEIAELETALARWFDPLPAYTVQSCQSGVRPNTRDKQPLLGRHPRYPQLAVFNGFGSRGSMLIPWHAQRMAALLTGNQPLPPEVDIRRYG